MFALQEMVRQSPVTRSSNVIINYMTPGFCRTEILKEQSTWLHRIFIGIMYTVFARTAEVGGRALTHSVTPNVGAATHGQFLMDCQVRS
jgi:hypothetical protein